MSNDEIRELIQLVVESGIAELELQRGDERVRIRRTLEKHDIAMSTPAATPPSGTVLETGPVAVAPPSGGNEHIVKSPIVGTYYESPKPGDPPFINAGDSVEPGQVLCIIESMKLMNEIESDVAGTVVAKLMETGRPVEYGEALFTIRPR